MARPRDSQRSKVYRSERHLSDHMKRYGGRLETVPEMQAWIDEINRSRWLKGYIKRHPHGIAYRPITVTDGRARRRACAELYVKRAYVKVPRWCRSKLVLLHEMAHVYTPVYVAWHGPEFCACYLDFVGRWLGREAKAELKAAFIKCSVKHRR